MPVFSHLQGACCKSTHWMVHRQTKTKQMAVMTSFYQYKVWNCSRANLLISDKTLYTLPHTITPQNQNTARSFLPASQHTAKTVRHTSKSNITNCISNTYRNKTQLTSKNGTPIYNSTNRFTDKMRQKWHKHLQKVAFPLPITAKGRSLLWESSPFMWLEIMKSCDQKPINASPWVVFLIEIDCLLHEFTYLQFFSSLVSALLVYCYFPGLKREKQV